MRSFEYRLNFSDPTFGSGDTERGGALLPPPQSGRVTCQTQSGRGLINKEDFKADRLHIKVFWLFKIVEYKGFKALALKALCSKIFSGGSLKKESGRCLSVCPSIFTSGVRTAGPIGTGEYSSMHWNGGKTMVPFADTCNLAQTLAKSP